MKWVWVSVFAIICFAIIGHAIWSASGSMSVRDAARENRCRNFRCEFFTACIAVEPRYRCEVEWARLEGQVFNGDPRNTWVDQRDCSEYFQ